MKAGKAGGGLVVAACAVLALGLAMPADAARPKPGTWFNDEISEENPSSVQFKVTRSGKKIKKVTIYWRCRNLSGYHHFTNPPFPIGINKKKKFKLVGATTPPAGQQTKDFTLKGRFISRRVARYSMELEGCGPATRGRMRYAG